MPVKYKSTERCVNSSVTFVAQNIRGNRYLRTVRLSIFFFIATHLLVIISLTVMGRIKMILLAVEIFIGPRFAELGKTTCRGFSIVN